MSQPPQQPPWPPESQQPGYSQVPPPPGRANKPGSAGVIAGAIIGGIVLFLVVDFVGVLLDINSRGNDQGSPWITGILTGVLALGCLGGGGLLAFLAKNPAAKAFGITLMAMWGLMSLVTLGICTGLNPGVYVFGNY